LIANKSKRLALTKEALNLEARDELFEFFFPRDRDPICKIFHLGDILSYINGRELIAT
jgi:hypothetical protein